MTILTVEKISKRREELTRDLSQVRDDLKEARGKLGQALLAPNGKNPDALAAEVARLEARQNGLIAALELAGVAMGEAKTQAEEDKALAEAARLQALVDGLHEETAAHLVDAAALLERVSGTLRKDAEIKAYMVRHDSPYGVRMDGIARDGQLLGSLYAFLDMLKKKAVILERLSSNVAATEPNKGRAYKKGDTHKPHYPDEISRYKEPDED